jgi:alpha-beta hydrolase superfamily lysophospholipase
VSSIPVIKHYASQDARRLATRIWQCDDAIADVVYLHGIVSHGGWYESSCAYLAANGFQVHFLERRGSGLNPDNRGDVDDWTTWLSDVAIYLSQLPQSRPRIVLGVSWGGVLATSLARRHPELISGIGLICPGLFSPKAGNFAQRLGLRLAGMLGLNRMKVQVPLQDPALFTNSPKARRFIAQDPFTLRRITIRLARCNLELLRYATEAPEEIRVPVLLMLASRDPITQNQRTREFVGRIGHRDQTIIEYADASHTLEFEDDPSQYFQDLNAWCSRIAKGSC